MKNPPSSILHLRPSLPLLLFLAFGACTSSPQPLFNGHDLSGWRNVNGAPDTWTVRDQMIVCSGKPTGVMCTDRQYENYILELDWRHMTEGGNAGLFVHSDVVTARGQPFTRSTECQILDGNHGDVFAIHGATMVPDRPHPKGWMRSLPTEERAKPAGEWNHYRVESRDGRLTLAVNGKVVSGGTELKPRKGAICLESEGSEVHFRNIRIEELPSTNPSPDETAEDYRGFRSLYTGVDLSGWQLASASSTPWTPHDWVLHSEGGDGTSHLWSNEQFGDVELIADWRADCDSGSHTGIFLRGSTDAEIVLGCPASARTALITIPPDADDEHDGWMRLHVELRGSRAKIDLNGHEVATLDLPPAAPRSGPLGLADHGTPADLANIYVRNLD